MIVLLVVVLIFGTKKLRNIGQDLGGAVKGFKEGMKSEGGELTPDPQHPPPEVPPQHIGTLLNIMNLLGVGSDTQLVIKGGVILIAVFFTTGSGRIIVSRLSGLVRRRAAA